MNTIEKYFDAQAIKCEIQQCKDEIARLEKEYLELGAEWMWLVQEASDPKIRIVDLYLPTRTRNLLVKSGYSTVGDILHALDRGTDVLLAIRGLGQKGMDAIFDALDEMSSR